MCGIVGYIGFEEARDILIHGLKKLEYRGYDSAGIALAQNGELKSYKEKGRIANLEKVLDKSDNSKLGVGHTRWATHGEPSKINSHPHFDETTRFAVVHNGVIENFEKLKNKYLKDVELVSETDTEIIAQVLNIFVNRHGDVEMAIRQIMHRLHGSYALGIIDKTTPDILYAVKNKSPLLLGKGEGFNMIGSDVMAMLHKTNKFYEINDNEYVKMTKDKIQVFEASGAEIMERELFTSSIDPNDTDKGTYDHFMLKEIDEQPFIMRRLLDTYTDEGKLKIDDNLVKMLNGAEELHIIAAGTSYHSGLVAKYYFENIAKKRTCVHVASEFVYNQPLLCNNPLFIFISQSGETADSRAALVNIKKQGYKAVTVTNVEGSTLMREADDAILVHAGPEISVASTKAYTAQIAVLLMLACAMREDESLNIVHELSVLAQAMEEICNQKQLVENLAREFMTDKYRCFYIGRSVDYFSALEAALKMKEITYVQTEGFAAGELKHGTIALIENGTPVIAIISQEAIALNTRSNIKEVKARGANVLEITFEKFSQNADEIVLKNVHPMLAPLLTAIPCQLLAYYTALHRNLDIDKPRNLAKSVTVE